MVSTYPFANWSKTLYVCRIIQKLEEAGVDLKSNDTVLDLGCGDGSFSFFLSENATRVIGLDVHFEASWKFLKNDSTQFIMADARALPIRNESVNIIFAKDALHHITEVVDVLKEVRRVMKRGGTVALVEANRYNLVSYLHMVLYKKHQHFTQEHFRRLAKLMFKNAQFIVTEAHYYPISSRRLVSFLRFLEESVELIPLLKPYLNYNIAIGTKE